MKKASTPLYLLQLIVVIGIFSAVFINYIHFSNSMRLTTEKNAVTYTQKLSSVVTDQIVILNRILEGPTALIASGTATDKTIGNYLEMINENDPQIIALFFQSAENDTLITNGWTFLPNTNVRLEEWYTKAAQNSVLTEIRQGQFTKLTFSRPVFSKNGKRLGVLGGIVEESLFQEVLENETAPESTYEFLFRKTILGDYESLNPAYLNLVQSVGKSELISSEDGVFSVSDAYFESTPGLLNFKPILNSPWYIGTFTSLLPLENQINRLKFISLAVLGILILLIGIVIFYQRKVFTKPILELENHISNIDLNNPEFELISEINAPQYGGLVGGINMLLYKIRHYSRETRKDQEKLKTFNQKLEESLLLSQTAQNGLMLQKNQFEALFKNSTDAILILNHYRQVVDFNHRFSELFGYEIDSIRYREPDNFLSDEDHREESIELTSSLYAGKAFELETERLTNSGEKREVTLKGVPVLLGNEVVGAYQIYNDITVRKRSEYDLKYLSYHDQLTGLYNRRFFEVEMNRLDTDRNLPLAILMCDVNGLKITNDAFGHAMGDRLLVRTAEILRRVCRSEDIVARWGGDEFVILLPKTDKAAALDVFERIKLASKDEVVNSIMISISIGFAIKTDMEELTQEVFKDAENRMYSNKLYEGPSMRGQIVQAILSTLHEKNPREELHSRRVSQLCGALGAASGCNETDVEALKTFGLLHDIGKIAIYENLLNKNAALSDDEWMEMRRHPEIGYRILSAVNDMSEIADLTLAHHENWDGSGYPKGICGTQIPVESRMIQLADAFDAMTSDRPYRKALSIDIAVSEIVKNAGRQFDPDLSRIFVEQVLQMPWQIEAETGYEYAEYKLTSHPIMENC